MNAEFLILALFLPRVALFVFWMNEWLPHPPMPNWSELLLAVAAPRVLVLILIYFTMGLCGWFWVHLLAALLVYGGAGFKASRD
jgi:hypothetical protein